MRQRFPLSRVEKWGVAGVAVGLLVFMQVTVILEVNIWKVLGIALGLTAFVVAYRRPLGNARFLLVWLPLSPVLLAAMRGFLGVPSAIIKNGTYLRFLLVVALLFAANQARRRRGQPLEIIDRLAIAYVSIVLLYALITPYLSNEVLLISARMVGVQSLSLFVMAFLAIRWLDPSPEDRAAMRRWAYAVVMFIAVIGIWQRFDPEGVRRLMITHIDLVGYYREVSELSGPGLSYVIQWYWLEPVRVASLMLSPFDFADLVLAGAALGLVEMTHRFHPKDVALVAFTGLGIFFSGTRINLFAFVAMVVVALCLKAKTELAKVRFFAIAGVLAVAMLPLALGSRLLSGDDTQKSNEGHINEITNSFETLISQPLGGGVGNDGGITARFAGSGQRSAVSGNTILGIGIQVGVVGMFVFIALVIAMLERTRTGRSRSPLHDVELARLLIFGGLVSGITHNAWQAYGPGSFAWLLVGLGCGVAAENSHKRREPVAFNSHNYHPAEQT